MCLIGLLVLGILFLFRRKKIVFREEIGSQKSLFLSPTHGIVNSVRRNIEFSDYPDLKNEIRITLPFWVEKGLYLPESGEVLYLKNNKGKKIPLDSSNENFYGYLEDVSYTDMVIRIKSGYNCLLRFVDSTISPKPVMWMKSGDRGRGASCFGFYPLGGTLLIYLPSDLEILVYEGEFVTPGNSVIGVMNNLI